MSFGPDGLTYNGLKELVIWRLGGLAGDAIVDALLRAERLRCAQAICTRCAYGDVPQPINYDGFGSVMFAHTGNFICDASSIWELDYVKEAHSPD